jgi:hypothetical protein
MLRAYRRSNKYQINSVWFDITHSPHHNCSPCCFSGHCCWWNYPSPLFTILFQCSLMLMKLSITTLHHMLSQWSLLLVKLSITIFLICCVNCHSCWWNYSSPTFTICCFSGHCCWWHYPSHLFTICCFSGDWCEWNCTSQQYVMLLQLFIISIWCPIFFPS